MKKTVIGLVGPSGAGKGEVSAMLEKKGYYHIDTDLLARDVYADVRPQLTEKFGEVFDENGILNRPLLASKAFSSAENTEALNKIMHGAIIRKTEEIIKNQPTENGFIVDGAALFEANADKLCDTVIAILCDTEIRLNRVMSRDGITREKALERFARQKSDEFLKSHCEFTIYNDKSLSETEKELDKILDIIKRRNNT